MMSQNSCESKRKLINSFLLSVTTKKSSLNNDLKALSIKITCGIIHSFLIDVCI